MKPTMRFTVKPLYEISPSRNLDEKQDIKRTTMK